MVRNKNRLLSGNLVASPLLGHLSDLNRLTHGSFANLGGKNPKQAIELDRLQSAKMESEIMKNSKGNMWKKANFPDDRANKEYLYSSHNNSINAPDGK